jgi:hypothetical protein
MPDTKNIEQQKRSKTKRAGTVDSYNPVNMAGKTAEICKEPIQKDEPIKDNYNPVNMAGKKAALPKK